MSKLDWFTILVVGVCIAAILYLLYNMTNLFNNKNQEADTDSSTEFVDDAPSTDDDIYDEDTNIGGIGDEEMGDNSSDNGYNDEGESGIDYNDNQEPMDSEEDAETPADTEAEDPVIDGNGDEMRDDISSSLGNGKYMVIVGTYKYMASAKRAQKQLQNRGFPEASIEIFDNGKYARVLVGRSNDYNEAASIKTDLKKNGFHDVLIQEKRGSR